jgi:succinoglycan biosynthesis transport protein ExoP
MNAIALVDRNLQAVQPPAPDRNYGSDLLRILVRRKLVIIATVVVMTGAAALFAFLWPPTYRATSSLIIASSADETRSPAGTAGLASLDDRLIDSQVELLGDRPLLRRVVEDLKLFNDSEFGASAKATGSLRPAETATEKAVDVLRRKFVARRELRSAVITITAQTHSPQMSADIANAIATTHIEMQRNETLAANRAAIARLQPRIAAVQAQAIDADRAIATYRRQNNMAGVADGSDGSGLSQLSGVLADARSGRSTAVARAGGGAPMVVGAASPLLADLQRQAAETAKRIAELSTVYDDGYPELAGARAQLQEINARLAAETARSNAALKAEAAIAQARESQIVGDINRIRSQSFQDRAASVKLADLERLAAAANAQHVALLTEIKRLEVETGNAKVPARVLSRALVPAVAHFPKRQQTIVVAFAASLVIGILLALAIEQLYESRIRTAAQVERVSGVPTLGMLPVVTDAAAAAVHDRLVDRPRSLFSESARALYLNLRQRLPDNRSHVVLVTSPLPGEGKSTVAMCLATAAMTLRQTVVIIDFDLRRPQANGISAHIVGKADLADYLEGGASLADILTCPAEMPRLGVIGSSRPAVDPTGLLASPRLAELFFELRKHFQFIVVNTPPILAVRDAKTLAAMADATLLVVRWGETSAEALRTAAITFDAPFIGAVINRVDIRKHARAAFGDAMQHYGDCVGYYVETPSIEARPSRRAA